MKASSDAISEVLYACIDQANAMLPREAKLEKAPSTVLVGEGGVLDSLGLINLLVNLEEGLRSRFGLEHACLDEALLVDVDGPYRSVGHLVEWITARAK
jgi:acyl carrier protein